jgi:hypothetical protein
MSEHVCGARGFGYCSTDRCPACEADAEPSKARTAVLPIPTHQRIGQAICNAMYSTGIGRGDHALVMLRLWNIPDADLLAAMRAESEAAR